MTNSHDNPSAADILRIAVMYNGSPMSMHFSLAGLAADKSNQGDGTEAAWDPEAVYTGQTAGSLLEDMKRHLALTMAKRASPAVPWATELPAPVAPSPSHEPDLAGERLHKRSQNSMVQA